MEIKYKLDPLKIGSTNTYAAKVLDVKTINLDTLINRVCIRGGYLSHADVTSKIMLLIEEIKSTIQNGENLNLPFCTTNISIKGKFENDKDGFDPARHEFKLNMNLGRDLSDMPLNFTPIKSTGKEISITPRRFINEISKEVNKTIVPNATSTVEGDDIKVIGSGKDIGIFFTNLDTEEKMKVENIVINEPKRLVFISPELTPGTWELSIVTQISTNKEVGRAEIGILKTPLTVA